MRCYTGFLLTSVFHLHRPQELMKHTRCIFHFLHSSVFKVIQETQPNVNAAVCPLCRFTDSSLCIQQISGCCVSLLMSSSELGQRESRGVHLHAKSPSKEVYPCVHLSVHGTPRLSPDFFILCFPVPLSPRCRSFEGRGNHSERRKKESNSFLKRPMKQSAVIHQLFCLHRPGRTIRLLQDCPCAGLTDNPFCLPSLSDSLTCSLPSSIHLALQWCPGGEHDGGGVLCFLSVHLRPTKRQRQTERKGERCELHIRARRPSDAHKRVRQPKVWID